MLKHQLHFNAMEQEISSGETLFRDLEVALESLDQTLCWNQSLRQGDLTVLPSLGMESVATADTNHFEEAFKRIKDLIDKAIVVVREAFNRLVTWLSDRSSYVQRQIAHLQTRLKQSITGKLELTSATPEQSLGIARMIKHNPSEYFNTHNLREMVRVLDLMVQQTVKNDGLPGHGISMLLLRYDRFVYLWLLASEDGSGVVPQGTGASGYQAINSYLDDAPTPLEAFEFLLRKQPQELTWAITPAEALSRLGEMQKGLTRFSQDVIQPRRDADKLLKELASVGEIVSEEQHKQLRAMVRLINRNTGNMTAGYNFQVRIAQAAVRVLAEATK